MPNDWKQDPRLLRLSKEKLAYLESFSEKVKHSPKSELLPLLLQVSRQNPQMNFSDEETELLTDILTAHFSPKEKQQLTLLRQLSCKLSQKGLS
ncbi:MAG: hypothetical protein Q4D90_09310 [bacterium]|nr:hypothetical protein [bacterium]